MPFVTQHVRQAVTLSAPDGSTVLVLCATDRGSAATFTLPPGAVSKPVAHHSVEEIWYFLAGRGRLWRRTGDQEDVVQAVPGLCITIPTGTHFQFRNDGEEPLVALGLTMPPWPGEAEAYAVPGPWPASV